MPLLVAVVLFVLALVPSAVVQTVVIVSFVHAIVRWFVVVVIVPLPVVVA